MELNPAATAGIGRHAPPGGRYRMTIRDAAGALVTHRADAPLAWLQAFVPDPTDRAIRVEAAGPDGGFVTVIPWIEIDTPKAAALEVALPADDAGFPTRLRVIDKARKTCVADVAAYGSVWLEPAALDEVEVARLRSYRWEPEARAWQDHDDLGELVRAGETFTRRAAAPVRSLALVYEDVRDAILNDAAVPEASVEILSSRKADDVEAHYGACRTIYQVLRGAPRKAYQTKRVHGLGRRQGDDGPLREMAGYLGFYGAFNSLARTSDLGSLDAVQLAAQVPALLAALDEAEARLPAAGAHLVNRGKITSLVDRNRGHTLLQQAKAASPRFVEQLKWDEGLHTYLTRDAVAAAPPVYAMDALLPSLRAGLAGRAERYTTPRANLVLSMNPRFLRAHGPQWFELAPALLANYGLGLIAVMVGEAEEIDPLVDEARDLIGRTARFHGAGEPGDVARSVVFARVPLPAFVAAPVTFYACARYLHVRQIIAETGTPAIVLDADYTPALPFDALLKHGAGCDVSLPVSKGHAALSPWRRYMAGSGWFNATPGAGRFLEAVERYLLHGLTARWSWMLDQNALDYAIGAAADVRFLPLDHAVRPGGQDPIRKANEHPI